MKRKPICFVDPRVAQMFVDGVRAEFPHVRMMEHQHRYAVQIQPSGDYLAADGRPTLEPVTRDP